MDAAQRLLDALARDDWDAVRLALHPYLHWQPAHGPALRGRNAVLAMLREGESPGPPAAYELRDGQIYRWTASG